MAVSVLKTEKLLTHSKQWKQLKIYAPIDKALLYLGCIWELRTVRISWMFGPCAYLCPAGCWRRVQMQSTVFEGNGNRQNETKREVLSLSLSLSLFFELPPLPDDKHRARGFGGDAAQWRKRGVTKQGEERVEEKTGTNEKADKKKSLCPCVMCSCWKQDSAARWNYSCFLEHEDRTSRPFHSTGHAILTINDSVDNLETSSHLHRQKNTTACWKLVVWLQLLTKEQTMFGQPKDRSC